MNGNELRLGSTSAMSDGERVTILADIILEAISSEDAET